MLAAAVFGSAGVPIDEATGTFPLIRESFSVSTSMRQHACVRGQNQSLPTLNSMNKGVAFNLQIRS